MSTGHFHAQLWKLLRRLPAVRLCAAGFPVATERGPWCNLRYRTSNTATGIRPVNKVLTSRLRFLGLMISMNCSRKNLTFGENIYTHACYPNDKEGYQPGDKSTLRQTDEACSDLHLLQSTSQHVHP